VELKDGGLDEIENFQVLCKACHQQKNNPGNKMIRPLDYNQEYVQHEISKKEYFKLISQSVWKTFENVPLDQAGTWWDQLNRSLTTLSKKRKRNDENWTQTKFGEEIFKLERIYGSRKDLPLPRFFKDLIHVWTTKQKQDYRNWFLIMDFSGKLFSLKFKEEKNLYLSHHTNELLFDIQFVIKGKQDVISTMEMFHLLVRHPFYQGQQQSTIKLGYQVFKKSSWKTCTRKIKVNFLQEFCNISLSSLL
jgi:hypothetical protein